MPNWVAWRLDKKKLVEKVSRKGYGFRPDPNLIPKEAVVTQDYAKSGYDRGHMCPAGDSRWSGEAMKESFYMTNICPQHPNLNSGDWHELEQACRRWASESPIYIVCGPILYKSNKPSYIGNEPEIAIVKELNLPTIIVKADPNDVNITGFDTLGCNIKQAWLDGLKAIIKTNKKRIALLLCDHKTKVFRNRTIEQSPRQDYE